ncbi:MAG TPA: cation-translocating P-type ATPase [Flavilitoribacter sp.]|nr:cation-translocating P-type ATPase [Flavilitoribacter sp.]
MQQGSDLSSFQTDFQGLSAAEVAESRKKYGNNSIENKEESGFWTVLKDVTTEPMFVLLLVAAGIYFLAGEYPDGIIMVAAIIFVSAISLYQETRSRNALAALKKLTQPNSKVIRDGAVREIPTQEIVKGDYIIVEEGNLVPADADIVHSNDFALNESILTGESFQVEKSEKSENPAIYYGTLVVSGSAVGRVTGVGSLTELGKIGQSLEKVQSAKTPMQLQISSFVKKMAAFGVLAFLLVWGINYWKSGDLLSGLLNGLTLAMSVLPEEIPVAFTTFMALGAWRLIRMGVLTKQPQTVESLGAATVICIDKTGTITENRMTLTRVYCFAEDRIAGLQECTSAACRRVVEYAMWSSEVNPFEPMEQAIHKAYQESAERDLRPDFQMFHEYPLSGSPPMMTHLYENTEGARIIAAKGGWEAIVSVSGLEEGPAERVGEVAREMAAGGYRVLGVGSTQWESDDFPARQQDFKFRFEGLIALEDPPKPNISKVFRRFYDAGIRLKIISGDFLQTVQSIARQTRFEGADNPLTGAQVAQMDETQLREAVKKTNLFARMFPEAKLRVIEAEKANGEIVAMTGDGVNDAPALKSAHIGVAMGTRGTETAKRAASIVIIDDDLDNIADAVLLGRRIYSNFKKAVQYIISIHIPIILTVSTPLLLGWAFSNIFSPIHVIFFELIMGPTCSIIFENEPMEERLKQESPHRSGSGLFAVNELTISIIQGLAITAGVLFLYHYTMNAGYAEGQVRTVAFSTILLSNIFLTLVNRSFYYSVFRTLTYPNRLIPLIIAVTLGVLAATLYVPAVQSLFRLESIGLDLQWKCLAVAFVSVIWVEGYKMYRRRRK